MSRSRAWRRHHAWRMKRRVEVYYGGYARGKPRPRGRLARTRQPCSCFMCGNPRRYWREVTLQERRVPGEDRVVSEAVTLEPGTA